MTEASLAMGVASFLLVALNVWMLRRRAPAHDPRSRRDQVLAMMMLVGSTLGGPALMLGPLLSLSHGSEMSNIGDALLAITLAGLHLLCWPIVAFAWGRPRRG